MRNPWFEATPAIAAAGLAVASPAHLIRRTPMDASWRYAFLKKPQDADTRPVAFADVHALGRHIHQLRAGRAIELQDQAFFDEEELARDGVSVWIVADGQRTEYLGWAWLNGGGRDALRALLDAQQESRIPHRRSRTRKAA